jgi:assimilatory nitrate reductase catalytic subunit
MGGREVGGLANMLANHLDIENAAHRDCVQTFWNSPTICTQAGLKAVDLFEACASGKIKALWVMSTNPAISMPDADGVAAAISKVPFVAVSDIMAHTDTGDLADVLLPAAGWGEKDGTVTNSERRISRQRAFLAAPAGVRPDWQIICNVAKRMGWGDSFAYTSPEQIFAEYVALSSTATGFGRDLDMSVFADVNYAQMIPTQWPKNDKRFFADGGFFHPDGKARMLPVSTPPHVSQDAFTLNTGRNRDQWHTMTRSGKAPRLGAHLAEPYVEMHPGDARRINVATGDLVALNNTYGQATLRALMTDRTRQGQLFAPMHWTRQNTTSGWINALTKPAVDPVSGQPALKDSRVTVHKMDAAWYGFTVSAHPLTPLGTYAAVARTLTGWQAELAGEKRPADWAAFAISILQAQGSSVSQMYDEAGQNARIAFHEDGILTGLFFAAAVPVALARNHTIRLIGTSTSALEVLAGRVSAGRPDPGATVCACEGVGVNTVLATIAEGALSVEALGRTTCAGTNCGSCRPELAALIAQHNKPVAAQ